MTPQTAPNAAERSRDQTEADLSQGERLIIERAASLKPRDAHRVIEAMCALGSVAKLMVRGS
jgi:hypothetical protein